MYASHAHITCMIFKKPVAPQNWDFFSRETSERCPVRSHLNPA